MEAHKIVIYTTRRKGVALAGKLGPVPVRTDRVKGASVKGFAP